VAADVEKTVAVRNDAPRWLEKSISAATDLLFPPRCVACGGECESRAGEAMFCVDCDEELAICRRPTCLRCAHVCSTADVAGGNCANCRGSKLLFEAARAIGPYEEPLRRAVLNAKHGSFEALAAALGQRLAAAIEISPFQGSPDVVAAVPMHWLKRAWRGTNPAGTLAAAVARRRGLPLASGALRCVRLLRRQATLTPPERRRNVRGAFCVSRPSGIAGKRVLLVDDVMTTGATAHEGSRALLDAGAAAVFVATVARSSPDV
jgi:ComF family protein